MNKGSEAYQVLKSLLKPTLLILVWMSFLRLLLFLFVFYPQIGWQPDLAKAFFAGFRFDALVLGFAWIPVVVLTWLSVVTPHPRKLFFLWKLYFALSTLIVFDFSWMDLFWSAKFSTRLNREFAFSGSSQILDEGWKILGPVSSWSATILMAFSAMLVMVLIYRQPFLKDYSLPSKPALVLKAILSIFIVAFAARGTWTPHHLNIEHAQVSGNALVNQIPLNPLWNQDK